MSDFIPLNLCLVYIFQARLIDTPTPPCPQPTSGPPYGPWNSSKVAGDPLPKAPKPRRLWRLWRRLLLRLLRPRRLPRLERLERLWRRLWLLRDLRTLRFELRFDLRDLRLLPKLNDIFLIGI